jgi:heptosyltransferase-3
MELQNIRRSGRSFFAWLLRRKNRPRTAGHPRILVIRRNRMGDMICTLPLLEEIRRHFPAAHLAVACDAPGAPIARASSAVNETILLEGRGFRWLALFRNARRIQNFDWVIAAKGGFDRHLAGLVRLSNGARRIGFDREETSAYYTDPVPLPADPQEHQIETVLRLLAPLGVKPAGPFSGRIRLEVPPAAREFASAILSAPPLSDARRFLLINISSTSRLRFRPEDFLELIARILAATDLAIGLVAAPEDQSRARELAAQAGSERVIAIATPGPLELAALLERAVLFVTPEGGAAHLAAAAGTPAVVLWSEGPFDKWHSRAENHVFVRAEPGEALLSVERVWPAVLKNLEGG